MATRPDCLKALTRFQDELDRLPHVVGLGVVPLDEDAPRGGLAVGVYVDRAAAAGHIPPVLRLSLRGGRAVDVPTRVIEQGEVRLEPAAG